MEKVIKDSSENQIAELKDRITKDGHELSYVYNIDNNESRSELESLCTKKVSLYLRDPSENQIAQLKDIVAKDGHELSNVCEFIDKDESNSSLKSLRKKVKEGGVDIIYTYSLDHLANDPKDRMALLEKFWRAGVKVKDSQHYFPEMEMLYGIKRCIRDYLDQILNSKFNVTVH